MTPEHIAIVRNSFARLSSSHEAVVRRFHEKLAEIDPSVRRLFEGSPSRPGPDPVVALAAIARTLDDLGSTDDIIRDLGRHFAGYEIEERHYPSIRDALLSTLEEGFGPAFDNGMRTAWVAVYSAVSGKLIESARDVTTRAA